MNTKYQLSTTTKSIDLKNALTSYYGTGVTIHYEGSNNIVFSCPAITNKVIRIEFADSDSAWYGDSWTSGTTITNSIKFFNSFNSGSGLTFNGYAVLCPNAFLIKLNKSYDFYIIIGKLSNGNFLLHSQSSFDNTTAQQNAIGTLSDGTRVWIATMNGKFKSGGGSVLTFPIYFQYNTGNLLLNSDNTPAYILDIKQSPSISSNIESSTNFFSIGGKTYFQENYATYGNFSNAIVVSLV